MLYVIGIGPGGQDYLLPAARKAALSCGALAGGPRALALFEDHPGPKFRVTGDLQRLAEFLSRVLDTGVDVGVLVSGDVGFYSLLPFLRKTFPEAKLEVIPGISSLQLAFAKAGLPWQEAILTSAHGRPIEAIDTNPGHLLGLLTGKDNSPASIAEYLLQHGPNRRAWLGNNLSYPDEQCIATDLATLVLEKEAYCNAVLIVMPGEEEKHVEL